MTKLSHSQLNSYLDCPTKHFLHYEKKLRSKYTSAALLFGSALDKAVPALIQGLNYVEIFNKVWNFQEVNGKTEYLPFNINIVYFERDLDIDLLSEVDFQKISTEAGQENFKEEDIKKLLKDKEAVGGFENLPTDKQKLHNYIFWLSLYQKGLVMLESFKKRVLPNITKIHSLQETINLNNGEDSLVGFIDMVLEYKGYNKPIVFDLKTSSKNYEKDAVLNSQQLALYVHGISDKYDNTRYAGYFVINKNINKHKEKICSVCNYNGSDSRARKCDNEIFEIINDNTGEAKKVRCNGAWLEKINPEAFIQVMIDKIPEKFENLLLENVDNINKAIKAGHIYKNLTSCVKPYGKCQFYNLCHKDDDSGLVKL